MAPAEVPQPSPDRLTQFSGHPFVVGIAPGQPELVALTAASLARAGNSKLYFGYVDPARYCQAEFPDGTVRHAAIDPDPIDESWRDRQTEITTFLARVLADTGVDWEFRYLAGRTDRALTHLARAVDAAAIVVGTHHPGAAARLREFLEGSVAVHLFSHQHRPVLVVPLSVVDWKTALWK